MAFGFLSFIASKDCRFCKESHYYQWEYSNSFFIVDYHPISRLWAFFLYLAIQSTLLNYDSVTLPCIKPNCCILLWPENSTIMTLKNALATRPGQESSLLRIYVQNDSELRCSEQGKKGLLCSWTRYSNYILLSSVPGAHAVSNAKIN